MLSTINHTQDSLTTTIKAGMYSVSIALALTSSAETSRVVSDGDPSEAAAAQHSSFLCHMICESRT